MNDLTTTTTTPPINTNETEMTESPDYEFFHDFENPVSVIRIYQIGYFITFLIGLFGNTASLLTFSRPILRKISTGCLFITLAISDLSFLLVCVLDIVEFGLQVPFSTYFNYKNSCQSRTFIMNAAQFTSSWILVIVSIDRWIRTRFPFKSNLFCTPKKALLAVGVVLLISIGLHSHFLTPTFAPILPGSAITSCGPDFFSQQYTNFYFLYWGIIQILSTCILPAVLMTIALIDIIITIRIRKRAVVQPNQTAQSNQTVNRQKTLQKPMFILMFSSICIFLITSLPVGIYRIHTPRQPEITKEVFETINVWVALGWFQSLFYATGFYIHCLSSSFFRKEFRQQMLWICCRKRAQIQVMTLTKSELHNHTGHAS